MFLRTKKRGKYTVFNELFDFEIEF